MADVEGPVVGVLGARLHRTSIGEEIWVIMVNSEQEALSILRDEDLMYYRWFSKNVGPSEVTINKVGDKWHVGVTDERSFERDGEDFDTETDALTDFVESVRSINRWRRAVEAEFGPNAATTW